MSAITNTYTNIGPLTTIFTPPASCLSITQRAETYNFGHWGGGGEEWDCYPGFTSFAASAAFVLYYYSPALYCPSGWATANTVPLQPRGLVTSDGVSAALCCPSGFAANDGSQFTMYGYHQCSSAISSGQVLSNLVADISEDSGGSALSQTTIRASTFEQDTAAYGDGIIMLWNSADLKQFGSASKTSSSRSRVSSRTPANTNSATSTSTTTPPNTQSSTSGISAGAKAGIAVGIIAFAIVAILGIFFCFRRRNQRQERENFPTVEHTGRAEIVAKPGDSRNIEAHPFGSGRGMSSTGVAGIFTGARTQKPRAEPITPDDFHFAQAEAQGGSAYWQADSLPPTYEMPTSPVIRKAVPAFSSSSSVPDSPGTSNGTGIPELHSRPISKEIRLSQVEAPKGTAYPQDDSTSAAYEMPSSPIIRKSVSSISNTASTPATPDLNDAGESISRGSVDESAGGTRLRVLQERMERIREEKLRLQRIQELEELEEQTKIEILEQQRRTGSI